MLDFFIAKLTFFFWKKTEFTQKHFYCVLCCYIVSETIFLRKYIFNVYLKLLWKRCCFVCREIKLRHFDWTCEGEGLKDWRRKVWSVKIDWNIEWNRFWELIYDNLLQRNLPSVEYFFLCLIDNFKLLCFLFLHIQFHF